MMWVMHIGGKKVCDNGGYEEESCAATLTLIRCDILAIF